MEDHGRATARVSQLVSSTPEMNLRMNYYSGGGFGDAKGYIASFYINMYDGDTDHPIYRYSSLETRLITQPPLLEVSMVVACSCDAVCNRFPSPIWTPTYTGLLRSQTGITFGMLFKKVRESMPQVSARSCDEDCDLVSFLFEGVIAPHSGSQGICYC